MTHLGYFLSSLLIAVPNEVVCSLVEELFDKILVSPPSIEERKTSAADRKHTQNYH